MSSETLLLESCLKQAAKLVRGALKIETDHKKRLALKAALRYLMLAGASEEVPTNGHTAQFSQAAQGALDLILRHSSIRPGPDMLDAVLLKLELQERLTVSEILLRRELRAQLEWGLPDGS